MIVFRLSKSLYSNDLSGKGAEKAGARWNSKGIAMIYTSDSRALCTAEIAVHTPLGNVPEDYSIITIEIPEDSIREVKIEELPSDWKTFPHPDSTQRIGNKFIIDNIFSCIKSAISGSSRRIQLSCESKSQRFSQSQNHSCRTIYI